MFQEVRLKRGSFLACFVIKCDKFYERSHSRDLIAFKSTGIIEISDFRFSCLIRFWELATPVIPMWYVLTSKPARSTSTYFPSLILNVFREYGS